MLWGQGVPGYEESKCKDPVCAAGLRNSKDANETRAYWAQAKYRSWTREFIEKGHDLTDALKRSFWAFQVV